MLQFNMCIPALQLDLNYTERKKLVVPWPVFTEESFGWCRKVRCLLLAILTITSMLSIVSCFIFQVMEHQSARQHPYAIRAC